MVSAWFHLHLLWGRRRRRHSGWPAKVLTWDGGEVEALPAIEVAIGEGDRGTLNTGIHNLVPSFPNMYKRGGGAGQMLTPGDYKPD